MKIGVMAAMPEEIERLQKTADIRAVETRGLRDYSSGTLYGREVVLVFSRWGKVAASSTATTLIERYGVELILFTGVAGAASPNREIGDIVVASETVQHDMDASPIPGISRFEIPLLGVSRFPVPQKYVDLGRQSAERYLQVTLKEDVSAETLAQFQIKTPQVVAGLIASGDQFIARPEIVEKLRADLPNLQCVEMEGAAVAQVCHEHGVPMVLLRTISDKADHSAIIDFPAFVTNVASHFTCGIVEHLIREI